MQATRQEILTYLQRHGRATVRELGELLGLTSTGVRQHLTILERDSLVTAQEERGRVGRPALVYSLTERGRQLAPKRYDALSTALLDEVKSRSGAPGVFSLLKGTAMRMAEAYRPRVDGRDFHERVAETANIMQEQGLVVELEDRSADEYLLHECACPYPDIARRHPAVCALDVDIVSRLSGGDARLTESILRGDRACTYRIRRTTSNGA